MTGYGKIDILWLDGGWVRPSVTKDNDPQHYNQDIDMARIAKMGRSHQPGLIMVDRTVAGEFENYTTPEQEVPDKPLSYPWETCMTIGKYWSYVPDDEFKPSRQLVQTLIKIVSRGGNLLLNIAPGPDGDWNPVAYQRLQDIADWVKINGLVFTAQNRWPLTRPAIFILPGRKLQKPYMPFGYLKMIM
jgi:alpha-L-fucosidase